VAVARWDDVPMAGAGWMVAGMGGAVVTIMAWWMVAISRDIRG
jgi:hypothetical protein